MNEPREEEFDRTYEEVILEKIDDLLKGELKPDQGRIVPVDDEELWFQVLGKLGCDLSQPSVVEKTLPEGGKKSWHHTQRPDVYCVVTKENDSQGNVLEKKHVARYGQGINTLLKTGVGEKD